MWASIFNALGSKSLCRGMKCESCWGLLNKLKSRSLTELTRQGNRSSLTMSGLRPSISSSFSLATRFPNAFGVVRFLTKLRISPLTRHTQQHTRTTTTPRKRHDTTTTNNRKQATSHKQTTTRAKLPNNQTTIQTKHKQQHRQHSNSNSHHNRNNGHEVACSVLCLVCLSVMYVWMCAVVAWRGGVVFAKMLGRMKGNRQTRTSPTMRSREDKGTTWPVTLEANVSIQPTNLRSSTNCGCTSVCVHAGVSSW